MKRLALGWFAIVFLTGCSGQDAARSMAGLPPASQPKASCADTFAHAMASPDVVVHGAFACLTDSLKASAESHGIHSDADIHSFAQVRPIYSHATRCAVNRQPHVVSYQIDVLEEDGTNTHAIFSVLMDSHDLVSAFQANSGQACP